MFKLIAGLILAIFLFSNISALCNSTQVDINSASAEELDKIVHIGNTTAWKIINMRPFSSLDELVDVPYISANYTEDIKAQGLACISIDTIDENTTKEENQTNSSRIQINPTPVINDTPKIIEKPITADVIQLNSQNPKDIKTEVNVLTSENIAIYGLIAFCILLGILFTVRKIKKPRTEFEQT